MNVTLWRDEATFVRPVAAAAQRHDRRSRLFLFIEDGGVGGYGEVAPQTERLNGDPSIDDVIGELTSVTLPQLRSVVQREGSLPSWSRINRFAGSRASSAPAVALVEMALVDRELRASSINAHTVWPRQGATPLQTTVSLLDAHEPWIVDPSVARVRTKTGPGILSHHALDQLAALELPIVLDFNCSASSSDEVLSQVAQVARVASIAAVEQPFAPGNVIDHATLAARLGVALSLDEGVRSQRDLEQIARYRAARMVCVKPARVGGLANARTLIVKATELGLSPYLGGFFESPFARHVHRYLAENCVTEPSDLGPIAVTHGAMMPELEWAAGGFEVAPSRQVLEKSAVIATWT